MSICFAFACYVIVGCEIFKREKKEKETVQNQNDEINEINQCGATIAYFVYWVLYLKLTIDILFFNKIYIQFNTFSIVVVTVWPAHCFKWTRAHIVIHTPRHIRSHSIALTDIWMLNAFSSFSSFSSLNYNKCVSINHKLNLCFHSI